MGFGPVLGFFGFEREGKREKGEREARETQEKGDRSFINKMR